MSGSDTASARKRGGVRELAILLGVAVVLALIARTFLLETFYIPTGSMEPTLSIGDRVLVDRLEYRFHPPDRLDIVVFSDAYPPGPGMRSISTVCPEGSSGPTHLIKRVIGLPGDTVEGRAGQVYVDGQVLAEPFLPPGTTTSRFGPVKVPAGDLWVMGDNRGSSCDSRVFGPIPESSVVGEAFLRVWPFSRFGGL